MKTKVIASVLILGFAFSALMFMFIVGCGVTGGGKAVSIPRIYVSDVTNKRVLVIDPSSLTILSSIELTGATNPKWMALHPSGSKIYVSNDANPPAEVYVIDTNTNTQVATISTCANPRAMAFNSDASELFVICPGYSDVAVIDTTSDTYTGAINSSVGLNATGVAYNPNNNSLYITNYGSDSINMVTAEVGAYPPTSLSLTYPYDVVYSSTTNSIYVTTGGPISENGWPLVSIEASTLTIIHTWEASKPTGGLDPAGSFRSIAISPNGNLIYAGNHDYSYIDYLNPSNGSTLEAINTNSGAAGYSYVLEQIAFSRDSSKAYAVKSESFGTNQIIEIDTSGSGTRTRALTLPSSTYFGIVYKP